MENDPYYSPFLDRRPQTTDGRRLTRWQKQVGLWVQSRWVLCGQLLQLDECGSDLCKQPDNQARCPAKPEQTVRVTWREVRIFRGG
jgi:hypothetical protein